MEAKKKKKKWDQDVGADKTGIALRSGIQWLV